MNLRDLLLSYNPTFDEEKKYKDQMIAFFDEHPDCFLRSCLKGHFTASCWLLSKDRVHALLLHHKKLDRWLQLGGHCDGDPDVLNVALKEAFEESGIEGLIPISQEIFDIDIHTIPERPNEPEHLHLDVRFLLGVETDEDFVQNHESLALKWLHIDDDDYPESISRMVKKWRALIKTS